MTGCVSKFVVVCVAVLPGGFYLGNQLLLPAGTRVNGIIFFFSSRRRHTRFDRDWSSDVCSSDLTPIWWSLVATPSVSSPPIATTAPTLSAFRLRTTISGPPGFLKGFVRLVPRMVPPRWRMPRSEERRVGKEGRSRWSPYH